MESQNISCSITNKIPSIFREIQSKGWATELVGKTHWSSHEGEVDLRDTQDLIRQTGFNNVIEIAGPRALQRVRCTLTDKWQKEGFYDDYKSDLKKRYGKGRTRNAWTPKPSCLPNQLYPDIWIADQAVKSLERMNTSIPWLLWVSFVGPHEPFDTPREWAEIKSKKPPKHIGEKAWISKLSDDIELKKNKIKWDGLISNRDIEEFRMDYANNISLLDDQVGKLIEALKEEKTHKYRCLITSDHGEMLGDYKCFISQHF